MKITTVSASVTVTIGAMPPALIQSTSDLIIDPVTSSVMIGLIGAAEE
jgi:hypothetical protein